LYALSYSVFIVCAARLVNFAEYCVQSFLGRTVESLLPCLSRLQWHCVVPVQHLPGGANWACTCCIRDWNTAVLGWLWLLVALLGGFGGIPHVATTTAQAWWPLLGL
jgi:hypothetical protein